MGILGKLFGRDKEASSGTTELKQSDVQRAIDGAFAVIRTMGEFFETNNPGPLMVADEKKLPFTKEQIRMAVLIALRARPTAQEKELLKYLFLEIANWQPGVGEKDVGPDYSLLDTSKETTPEALLAQAKLLKADEEKFKKWAPIIEEERSKAQQTLERLGHW
jgi:hypothetical protein